MFVAVERDRAAMLQQIAFQCLEVTERALRFDEAQFHQRTGHIVNEHKQGAWIAAILEPTMVRPVDLDQLAKAFTAQPQLMDCPALFAGEPNPVFLHPFANRLARDFEAVMFSQHHLSLISVYGLIR